MSDKRTYNTEVYQADKVLPEHLQLWLNKHNSHGIYSTCEWFYALSQFKKRHQHTAAVCYCWLFMFDQGVPCIAIALETNARKLKLITNFYTPFCDIFYDKTVLSHTDAWTIILNQLSINYPEWLSLEIAPVFPDQFAIIKTSTAILPVSTFQYHFSVNYHSNLTDFATYWSSRSSRLKNTYQRRLKTLAKHNSRLDIYTEFDEEVKQLYWQIYQQSWKIQEPSEDFINWLMVWAGQNKKLQLGVLRIDEQPAAFQLWLLEGNTASIYKLAQDKQFDSFSPGTVLTKSMIERLSEEHNVQRIDFLLGNDDFKSLWMDSKTDVVGIEIINQTSISGKAFALMYKLRDQIKQRTGINFSRRSVTK
uniref:BioF2-like acetyltransferase domain-containing protein n=1 Tax=Rheinheimera sp. BAL341 TaxID=1708203 RepID=A0A486XQR5_9GAMM